MNIPSKLNNLELPTEEYIVVGSGILNALGIRESNDIDLVVSVALFEHLEGLGIWKEEKNQLGLSVLKNGSVEAFKTWDEPNNRPNLPSLKLNEQIIDDIPYVSLNRLRDWKNRKARPKDKSDVALIDEYTSKNS